MKRLLASLMLIGSLGLTGVTLAEEPMPAPAVPAAMEAAPAPEAAMPAEALDFDHGDAGDTDVSQGLTHVVQLERLDDGCNQFHYS